MNGDSLIADAGREGDEEKAEKGRLPNTPANRAIFLSLLFLLNGGHYA